jgi:helicase
MDVDKLIRYGIPESIIKSWKEKQGEKLLPLQVEALTKYKLLEGESLVISAPTSSGKTFCGEMAGVANIFHRKKAVFLVPLKAIAEEKYSDFFEKYGSLGIKVIVCTKDRKEFDSDLEKGHFDLAIVIYEKFNQVLIKNMDILSVVNLIVVDELQMMGDPSRGCVLELILTKILNSKSSRCSAYKPQILGLSAVLKGAEELADWLGCKLLEERTRPVELFQGILLNGKLKYRKYNSKEEGEEEFALAPFPNESSEIQKEQNADLPQNILFALLEKLVKNGEQVLVFLRGKFESERMALDFCDRVDLPSAFTAINSLNELEQTSLKEKLLYSLQKGIAFHNADLSYDERRIVENSYLKGEIKVIFCTTTLALGVNLPAKTVFIETQKYQAGEYSDKGIMVPLSWGEYENMSGRAGRFKLEKDFGRSIIIAFNQFHFESLWEEYIEKKEEKLCLHLFELGLEEIVLDLLASGGATNACQLERILAKTFTIEYGRGKLEGASTSYYERGRLALDEASLQRINLRVYIPSVVESLVEKEILMKRRASSATPDGNIFASEFGRICALKGISIDTGVLIKKKLDKDGDLLDALGWFYDLLSTPNGEKVYVNVGWLEKENRIYEQGLKKRIGLLESSRIIYEELRKLLDDGSVFTPQQRRKVKLCLLFSEWITEVPTLELEKKYSLRSGFIHNAAEQLSWLLDSAFSIAQATNKPEQVKEFLKKLSLEVQFGVNPEGIELAQLRMPGLGRDHIWGLVANGLGKAEVLKKTELKTLEKVLPSNLALKLISTLNNPKDKPGVEKEKSGFKESRTLELVLDGSSVRDRFSVLLDGKSLDLPAKSFKYLFKLAWAKFKKEDGWLHKFDLEQGDNQAKYLYRLKRQMGECLKMHSHILRNTRGSFIENNRVGSYRLNVPKNKIEFNFQMLKKNPDWEIREMASGLEGDR